MMRGTHAGSRSSLPATLPQHAADGAWRRWPRSSAGAAAASRVRPLQRLSLAALAGQQDAQPAAQQQAQQPQQQQSQQSQQSQVPEAHIPVPLELWDMNLWHYQPWWLQPPLILGTGLAFVLVSLALDNEDAGKTLALAAPVVVLYWGIALFLLPRRFKSFAVSYIESHPEAEEAALEQLQEALEQQQHEAEEQQQLQQQQQQDVQS